MSAPVHERELILWGDFDGETYDRERDRARLAGSLRKLRDAMADGEWYSLADLALIVECSEAGASARLRDLRKRKFGAYTIERENAGGGLWFYRMALEGERE